MEAGVGGEQADQPGHVAGVDKQVAAHGRHEGDPGDEFVVSGRLGYGHDSSAVVS
jgi:hypothetical protein